MPCHPYAVLDVVTSIRQSDGTYEKYRLSLLDGEDGIWLMDWQPGVLGYKGGGTIVNSPLAEGVVPIQTVWDDVSETFTLGISGELQDETIRAFRALGERLVEAVSYYTSWSEQKVWLEAKTAYETNTRYAVIKTWSMPGHNNPFQNPFTYLSHREAALSNVPLTITHLPWQHTEPGTGECVETSGLGTREGPSYLSFTEGDDDNVNCGSDGSLDDLPDSGATAGDIQISCWVNVGSLGQSNTGKIVSKGNWELGVASGGPGGNGFRGEVICGGNTAVSLTTGGGFAFDTWMHVLMIYSETTAFGLFPARTIYIAINGTWAGYTTQVASVGAYASDAANDLIIGNVAALNEDFEGYITNLMVDSAITQDPNTGNFTPPPRCAMPPQETNNELHVIYEGTGTTTSDLSGNGNDGTITGADWGNDCSTVVGRSATCLDESYVVNKQNDAQLTHIFYDDGGAGTYSANLLGETLPYALYPAVPAANDVLYIGICTDLDDTGPFNNVVFDIETIQNDLTMGNGWEYWDGAAWAALTEYDGTEQINGIVVSQPFTNSGVRSIHFPQPDDWTERAINGVTGFWIRLEITAVGAAPSPPTQQNRQIYTVTWPYIAIDDEEVLGDITALLRFMARNRSGNPLSPTGSASLTRLYAGLRSAGRGSDFQMWLNAADEQNVDGITFTVIDASASLGDDTEAPSGRAMTYSPAAAVTLTRVARWGIGRSVADSYNGRFNIFLRVDQTSGNAGDFSFRIRVGGYTLWDNITKIVFLNNTAQFQLLQFGPITMPNKRALQSELSSGFSIELEIANDNAGGGDVIIYDIALLPADEWTGQFYDIVDEDGTYGVSYIDDISYLDVDDIGSPKDFVRVFKRYNSYGAAADIGGVGVVADEIVGQRGHIGLDRAILQSNEDQELYFISEQWISSPGYYIAKPSLSQSLMVETIYRYLSMRGDS
jgi:hypothetical protein